MGLSYTPGKGWNVSYEKTDYKNDYNTNLPVSFYIEFDDKKEVRRQLGGKQRRTELGIEQGYTIYKVYPNGTTDVDRSGTFKTFGLVSDNNEKYEKFKSNMFKEISDKQDQGKKNAETNKRNQELNDIANESIARNTNLNKAYNTVINIANGTKGNDYLNQRSVIEKIGGISPTALDNLKKQYKLYYVNEKVSPWSTSLAKAPPYGEFKSDWYLKEYSDVQQDWDTAVAQDNVDVTYRFGNSPSTWAQYHYTNFGSKPSQNRRGNPTEATIITDSYLEKKLTDAQLQELRDKTLGVSDDIGEDIQSTIENTPELSALWKKAREGDEYWQKIAQEQYLDLSDPNDFYYAFTTSEREQDKALAQKLKQDGSLYITDLEEAILDAAGNKSLTEVKKFGALVQNVLQDTVNEVKKAKLQEQNLNLYKGLPGFEEIFGLSSTLSESILGDSGIGGYMGFVGGGEYADNLEQAIQQAAGLGLSSNSVIYNWEKWFTDTLAEKYVEQYSDLFDKELSKLNILEAVLPGNEEFNDYVNSNEEVLAAYDNKVRQAPLGQIPSKAEFGKQHWESTGSKNKSKYNTSMFKDITSFYDAKTGLFTEDFLRNAYFNTTGELVNFLQSLEGDTDAQNLLATITNGKIGDGVVSNDLESLRKNIEVKLEDYDKQKNRDINLDYVLNEENQSPILVESQFVRDFIQDYLKPRFDYSRSMDEFIEYMDVRQEEQNPFQTQNILDALKLTAEIRAESVINEANNKDRAFDPTFYFDPLRTVDGRNVYAIDEARKGQYEKQKQVVADDWDTAKANPNALIDPSNPSLGTWAQQAYRYGLDLNNKNSFSKLHYETKGKTDAYKFDGAEDNYTLGQVRTKIYQEIFPELLSEAEGMSGVFGQFITPEEFADEALAGVELFSDEQYEELLDSFGLGGFKGTIDELKSTLQEALQGGSALDIREGIKYLNEQRKKPTQEKLGITYIQRESDYQTGDYPAETQLYKMFQSAGYAGDEDQFYEEFFPDVDRKEQSLLSAAGQGKGLDLELPDLSDPYAALSSISSLFPEDEDLLDEEGTTAKPKTSYFTVGLNEDLSKKYKQDEDLFGDLSGLISF